MTEIKKINNLEVQERKGLKNVEEVLEEVGGFGKYQVLILVLIICMEIPCGMVIMAPAFTGANPEFWLCGNTTIPRDQACSCNSTLLPIDPDFSIVTEWKLVCKSAWVSDMATSMQMVGTILGNIIGAQLSDWYGRRFSLILMTCLMAIGTIASACSPDVYVYVAARLLCGMGFQGYLSVGSIYSMEFLIPKFRPLASAMGQIGLGIVILGIMGRFITHWRLLLLATAIPYVALVITIPLLSESPRWLLHNNKVKKCHTVVKRMADLNGCAPVREDQLQRIADAEKSTREEGADGQARFSYLEFWRDKGLRKTTLCLMAIWFAWGLVYYGMCYNIKNLKGENYLNVIYIGLTDVLGFPSSLLISNRLGRLMSIFLTLAGSGVALLLTGILQLCTKMEDHELIMIALCILGKFGTSVARSLVRTLTGESYPTAVRTMGVGVASITACLGGFLGTEVILARNYWPPLPYFAFGIISILGPMAGFLMEETTGKPLADEVVNVERASIKYKPEIVNNAGPAADVVTTAIETVSK